MQYISSVSNTFQNDGPAVSTAKVVTKNNAGEGSDGPFDQLPTLKSCSIAGESK